MDDAAHPNADVSPADALPFDPYAVPRVINATPRKPHPAPAEIPGQLWMLQTEEGVWCLAADNADALGGHTYLVAFDEAAAIAAARHQDEFNEIPCRPVRVK